MKKVFDEKGGFTEHGNSLLLDFQYGLAQVMTTDEVFHMSESELRLLGSLLSSVIGNVISARIARKLQISSSFTTMTDAEFESYLENKYGVSWRFMSLTEEEMVRVPKLTDEQIKEALEEGARDRKSVEDFQGSLIDPSIR